MVAARNDIRHFPVETFERPRTRLPHLPARAVEHLPVGYDVLVLLDHIPRTQHGPDMQVIDIVGDPRSTKFEDRLVDGVLDVSLGVSQQDHRERRIVRKTLAVCPVLSFACKRQQAAYRK